MRIEGHGHCGRIAYEATVDPDTVGIRHCADCQTLSGAPHLGGRPSLERQ
jgi:hypothetical protein